MANIQRITAFFNGEPCSVEYSLTTGVGPGSGTAIFPNTSYVPARKGTLVISDGTEAIVLTNMYADKPRIVVNATSGHEVLVTIYDRRYAWQWGKIIGTYNQPDYNGIPKQEKTLEELIALCLEALGESQYESSGIPRNIYPTVNWEYDNPAAMLGELCEEHGLIVGMRASAPNIIIITSYGYDRFMPNFPAEEVMGGTSGDILPAEIHIVGNRNVLQQTFLGLVPVGLEKDGALKRIEDLSYKPADWSIEATHSFRNINDAEEKELAIKCIYKWYSIDWRVYDIDTVLPLLSELSDTVIVEGVKKKEKPYIYAQRTVWDNISLKKQTKSKISEGFTLDRKSGVVKFPKVIDVPNANDFASGGFGATEIDLVASYEAKTGEGSDFFSHVMTITGGTELPVVLKINSLVAYYVKNSDTSKFEQQNKTEIEEYLQNIIPQLYEMYTERYPEIKLFPKIMQLGAYGAFNSITWRADPITGATTEVQKHIEIPRYGMPTFKDKRDKMKIKVLWDVSKRKGAVRNLYPYD